MKRIIVFISLMLALLTFVAIYKTNFNNTNSTVNQSELNQPESKKVELTLWVDDITYAEAIIPAIEAALPHIDLNYEYVGTSEARAQLELLGPKGEGADIFFQPHDGMRPSVEAQILLPLEQNYVNHMLERHLESSMEITKFNGNYYGVPLAIETLAFFYNETLLQTNQFEVARTFEEIKKQAQIYNDESSHKFLFKFQASIPYDMHFFLTAAGYELYGPHSNDATLPNFETQAFINGLTYFESMKEILPVNHYDLHHDTVVKEFALGNVPYIITGPWSINEIKAGSEQYGFEWGISKLPTIEGQQPYTFGGHIMACISAYTKHPKEAYEVVEFLSSEQGLKIMYETTGKIPALKDYSAIEGVLDNPYTSGIIEQVYYTVPMPSIIEMYRFWETMANIYPQVWQGAITPEEASEKAMYDYQLSIEYSK